MSKRTFLLGMSLLAVGLAVGMRIGARGESTAPTQAGRDASMLAVSVVRAERRSVPDIVRVVGQTRSREDVTVMPELSGLRVLRIEAEAGDYVRAGQTLAVLDGRSLGIERDGLRSEYDRTRGEFERARSLVSSQLVSREFFKQKQAAYEQARAGYENASLSVQRTQVVAPAAGLIYRRNATIGGLTDGTQALFEIAKDGDVEMVASVPEAFVGRLSVGMQAKVAIAGRRDAITGEIRLISPNVDVASRAADVRIRLHGGGTLPVGAFGQASIDVAHVEGWALPRSALQQDSAGSYVWRVDGNGVVSRQAVTPTMQTEDTVIVRETLGGAEIVARAGPFLREKDRVKVVRTRT